MGIPARAQLAGAPQFWTVRDSWARARVATATSARVKGVDRVRILSSVDDDGP